MSSLKKPIRMPPVPRLHVKNPGQTIPNPCIAIMSQMLGTSAPIHDPSTPAPPCPLPWYQGQKKI